MGIFSDVLLTVDYDRTLTAPDSTIPERNLGAIRYFIENGGAFTVNTGRSVPMTKVFRDRVPVNAPLLLYNGSAAYDVAEKKLTFCHAIDLDLWETVRRCEELFPDLTVEVQGVDAHYRFSENPMWDAFSVHQNCAHAFAREGDDLGDFLKFTLYGEFRDVTVADMFTSIAGEKSGWMKWKKPCAGNSVTTAKSSAAPPGLSTSMPKVSPRPSLPASSSSIWAAGFWSVPVMRKTISP